VVSRIAGQRAPKLLIDGSLTIEGHYDLASRLPEMFGG
jgi:hypothetical protein